MSRNCNNLDFDLLPHVLTIQKLALSEEFIPPMLNISTNEEAALLPTSDPGIKAEYCLLALV